ncbi:hypothetical protein GQ457_13G011880 [Hibiscus cannabinus]
MMFSGLQYRYGSMRTDTSKGFRLLEIPKTKRCTGTGMSTGTHLLVPIQYVFKTPNGHIDASPNANIPQRLYAYRYTYARTGTLCTRSADLARKSISTAPKHPRRSPMVRSSFGTIKDTSKHP